MNRNAFNYLLLHGAVGHGIAVENAAFAFLCVSEPSPERRSDEEPPRGILRRISDTGETARAPEAVVMVPPRTRPAPRARPWL